ncbi:MAG: 3-hydroxyisobutyrate dehydrogenase [Alphaproteobacteria bacterium]|nr:3-hydroxyisobutyrate dehydrogenase [Alphaproteobacteria bacterium]
MSKIGFIGLGNMGGPMVANLITAGHEVSAFDISADALARAVATGATAATNGVDAAKNAEIVITMLPAGKHVRSVFLEDDKVMDLVAKNTLLIDCSTIDVVTARAAIVEAEQRGLEMVDAPVSGGIGGAQAGTLTFMCGGTEGAFARAEPILKVMGKNVFHAGDAGAGQAVKVCNNLMLAIQMISVSEGFALGDKLGLDRQKLFDIVSTATSQCWAMTSYCPVPGPVPSSPANNDYAAGFTVAMMLKDLLLAREASSEVGATTPLGSQATDMFAAFAAEGNENLDFSAIFKQIEDA